MYLGYRPLTYLFACMCSVSSPEAISAMISRSYNGMKEGLQMLGLPALTLDRGSCGLSLLCFESLLKIWCPNLVLPRITPSPSPREES